MTTYAVNAEHVDRRQLRAVRRFFVPFPKWTIVVTALAATMLLLAVDAADGSGDADADDLVPVVGAGTLFVLAAVVVRLAVWASRPSPQQMDRWLERDLDDLRVRARQRCGLPPPAPPSAGTGPPRPGGGDQTKSPTVLLTGPRFGVSGVDFGFRVARRGIVRYTPVGVTILNFTQHQILAYQCVLDRLTGNALHETTDEYFYQDVVSLSTRIDSLTIDKRKLTRAARRALRAQIRGRKLQMQEAEVFTMTTSGGTTIEVVISVLLERLDRAVMGPGGHVAVDDVDAAIAGMRKMLREKKIPSKPVDDLHGL